MGAEPWAYFVPYEADVQAALDRLKEREFRAGRFQSGAKAPTTIAEARKFAGAGGTGSILDMDRVAAEPDYFAVAPLSPQRLPGLFGSERPTREMIESNHDFYEEIERGQGIYIVVYADGEPAEIFFAGYSFD
jgi:hypothetical protein